jgi:hypothetical protein
MVYYGGLRDRAGAAKVRYGFKGNAIRKMVLLQTQF